MKKALLLSLIIHFLFVGGVMWSSKLSLVLYKQREKKIDDLGSVQVSLLYKPTHTKMRKGDSRNDLPPPKVPKAKKAEEQMKVVKKPKPKPKKPEKKKSEKKKPEKKEPNVSNILKQIRSEIANEDEQVKKMPKLDNFPKTEDGDETSLGTGGRALAEMSPAQQALQAAMRRHFELPNAIAFRKMNPDAQGIIDLKLIGVGNRFEIVSLSTTISSGFTILDQSCVTAIRKAMSAESFSNDIISELSGKENTIRCSP